MNFYDYTMAELNEMAIEARSEAIINGHTPISGDFWNIRVHNNATVLVINLEYGETYTVRL